MTVKNFTMNVEEELLLLAKYNLTPSEIFVLKIILLAQETEDNIRLLQKYLSIEDCRSSFRDTLISLQNKGVILKTYKIPNKGESFKVDDVEISKLFIKNLYKCSFYMGKELFEHYPQFTNINGVTVGIRSVSKKYDSLEDAYVAYGKAISWNPEVHNHIIELVDWAKENTQAICCTLANFIVDNKWTELESLKSGDLVNVNYNSIKIL